MKSATLARRALLVLSLALAPLAVAPPVHAQAADKAAAESLFNEALKLYEAKRYADAAPKFAESLRLEPGIGVMLYLADCYEQTGKTASAWAEFREAQDLASKTNDPRGSTAKARADKLEASLSRMAITLAPGADVAGLEVKRDGVVIGKAQLGTAVPVDPGAHTITAAAPGKKPWESTVQVAAAKANATVTIPELESLPASPAPSPTPAPSAAPSPSPASASPTAADAQTSASGSSKRTLGIVLGGVGLVGVGVGAFFGLQAKSNLDDSNAGHCGANNKCDATGVGLRSDAQTSALLSTIGFGVGVAGLAAGAYFFFTAPKSGTAPTVGIAPSFDGRTGGAIVRGSF
jgi:hypothetical protein